MIYEYRCDAGHVIEAHVKLSGEGTPSACTQEVSRMDAFNPSGKPRPCGKPLTRILSVGSAYFPGAGSWRGA